MGYFSQSIARYDYTESFQSVTNQTDAIAAMRRL